MFSAVCISKSKLRTERTGSRGRRRLWGLKANDPDPGVNYFSHLCAFGAHLFKSHLCPSRPRRRTGDTLALRSSLCPEASLQLRDTLCQRLGLLGCGTGVLPERWSVWDTTLVIRRCCLFNFKPSNDDSPRMLSDE